jgi:hypothetical protein
VRVGTFRKFMIATLVRFTAKNLADNAPKR